MSRFLGANGGITSMGNLLLGVISAEMSASNVAIVSVAGPVASALSMAGGEYVSVSSQSDIEKVALKRCANIISTTPDMELRVITDLIVSEDCLNHWLRRLHAAFRQQNHNWHMRVRFWGSRRSVSLIRSSQRYVRH